MIPNSKCWYANILCERARRALCMKVYIMYARAKATILNFKHLNCQREREKDAASLWKSYIFNFAFCVRLGAMSIPICCKPIVWLQFSHSGWIECDLSMANAVQWFLHHSTCLISFFVFCFPPISTSIYIHCVLFCVAKETKEMNTINSTPKYVIDQCEYAKQKPFFAYLS